MSLSTEQPGSLFFFRSKPATLMATTTNHFLLLLMVEIRRSPVEVGSETPTNSRVGVPSQVGYPDFSHQQ